MKKILIVVDMQNDFINGSLGTKEARAIVPAVIEKIRSYPADHVYATRDTHPEDYLQTQEGKYLPIPHCIRGTHGWQIQSAVKDLLLEDHIFNKPTFGSFDLVGKMHTLNLQESLEIELIGLCTDICVISNALLLKAALPETKISVDPLCCAGVTVQKHLAALEVMRSCQIQGI